MASQRQHPLTNTVTCDDAATLVFRALENERCLDVQFRKNTDKIPPDSAIPNYKVLKQMALVNRLGVLYPSAVAVAALIIPLLAPLQWLQALFQALLPGSMRTEEKSIIVRASNAATVNAALDSDDTVAGMPRLFCLVQGSWLSRQLGMVLTAKCALAHVQLLSKIFRQPYPLRRDLVLHARDAFTLIQLAFFAQGSNDILVTDDHYQRWSFILSHAGKDARVVQHGFLDTTLLLTREPGSLSTAYVRHPNFEAQFRRFYEIRSVRCFYPKPQLIETPISPQAILLASSFPSIDEEIKMLQFLRQHTETPIIVKFHPAHQYDGRQHILAKLASEVFDRPGNPACRLFVSYNSFMEFDYSACDVPTVSIARAGDALAAGEQILRLVQGADKLKPLPSQTVRDRPPC